MDKKIKILVVPDDFSGVSKFRSIGPHQYIQEHYGDKFDIDIIMMKDFPRHELANFFSQYDIIQMHKQFDKECKVMDLIKFLGIPVVLDIDDHFKIGQDHPMHLTAQKEGWANQVLNHIEKADYVTTTTSIFADKLRKYNKNVYVFPNAIDPDEPQFKQTKKKSDKIRFGIVCGSTHMKDIELMAGIDLLPQDVLDKMQIVLCGFDTNGTATIYNQATGETTRRPIMPHESVWCRYEEFLTKNYNLVTPEHAEFLKKYIKGLDDQFENDFYRRFWTKDVQNYAKHYENVDVLLAPLKDNEFNSVKSFLKFTECGFTDTAIIASNFGPYTLCGTPYIEKGGKVNPDGDCLLVEPSKNHKQWAKYIKYLVENPEVIDILKHNLSKNQRERYSMEKICKDRVELYRERIKNKHN